MSEDDSGALLRSSSSQPYTDTKNHFSSRPNGGTMKKMAVAQILSYVLDWVILIIVGVVGLVLERTTPNKRPFSLQDPNISFPVTEHETVNFMWLFICIAVFPAVIILAVTLIFVPGPTVPPGTPKAMIWKRKLWELHTGWLGLALSLMCAWIITQGMKNLFGKPRPDLLDRCQPDVENWAQHMVGFPTPSGAGGNAIQGAYNGQLVAATICQNPDERFLNDGFRSYPSGHASSSAAGLIYLSLLLASKFAITIPFVPADSYSSDESSASAFPSRVRNIGTSTRFKSQEEEELSYPNDPAVANRLAEHNTKVLAVRRQAAAPPIYLLVIAVLPFFTAIFIASSRWFDFRHHGFDILFGFIIGTITACYAFRYYHLPISSGAGWAWGPRSHDKAFWAGVGSYSYATDRKHWDAAGDVEERLPGSRPNDFEMRAQPSRRPQDYEEIEYRGADGPGDRFERRNLGPSIT
ncbi:hypothetical protein DL769_004061 [Monosporascus sp. CRB-8-3]|nr:hypothetical protein DL769_004061 [Monosporascus sp. CRB-8-3]